MTMFGVHVGPQMCTMAELTEVWRTAEEAGYDWVSIWDHFQPAPTPADGDCFEGVACHAALAALTERVRVGSLVYSTGYRHPAVLANAAVTIDHISGGRLELGLGAGWLQPEYQAYGIPFEPPAVRLRRLAEYAQVVRALWTQETVDFDGEFFTLREARCNPKPLQEAPRIWIGAVQPRAVALAARIGDGLNVAFLSPEMYAERVAWANDAAPDASRLAHAINAGFLMAPDDRVDAELEARFGAAAPFVKPGFLYGSVGSITEQVGRYVDAGAQWVILALRAPFDVAALHTFATEVIPTFRDA